MFSRSSFSAKSFSGKSWSNVIASAKIAVQSSKNYQSIKRIAAWFRHKTISTKRLISKYGHRDISDQQIKFVDKKSERISDSKNSIRSSRKGAVRIESSAISRQKKTVGTRR